MEVTQEIIDSFYSTERELCFQEPFYGIMLMNMNKVFEDCETNYVSLNGIDFRLHISVKYWKALSKLDMKQRLACLKHELMHIAFFHLECFDHLSQINKSLANTAVDLSINCYLPDKPRYVDVEQDDGSVYTCEFIDWESYRSQYNLEPYKDAEYYFEKLMEEQNKQKQQQQQQQQGFGSNNQDDQGNQDDQDNQNDNQGDQSNQDNNQDSQNNQNNQGNQNNQNNNQLDPKLTLGNQPQNTHKLNEQEDPNKGDGYGGVSPTDIQMARQQVEYLLENVAKEIQRTSGKIPGELENILSQLGKIEPPKFNWKRAVRLFVGSSIEYYNKKSRRKKSRRFKDAEGTKQKHYCRICIFADTSGSVSEEELYEFISEVYHMQSKTKATIDVVCFDTKVYEPFRYKKGKEIPISGRGGTDFQEAINFAIDNKKEYDCYFLFTDGYDTVPKNTPNNLMWVLSSKTELTRETFEGKKTIKLN